MLQLARRIQRLEARHGYGTGLMPHTPEWWVHWKEVIDKIAVGAEPGEPGSVPLEVWDAIED